MHSLMIWFFLWRNGKFITTSKYIHCDDIIMSVMASQITSLTIVFPTAYLCSDQRKHQSSASLVFAREIHRWPMNSPHKGPKTWKRLPFDDVVMHRCRCVILVGVVTNCKILPHLMLNDVIWLSKSESSSLIARKHERKYYVIADGLTLFGAKRSEGTGVTRFGP